MHKPRQFHLTRREFYFLAAASLLATVAYLHQIELRSMWLDEVMSLNAAAGSWSDKWLFFKNLPEQHPLYYVLLTAWLKFGHSEFVLRSFSALWGIATAWPFYLLTRKLFGRRVGGVATFLLLCSPYWIYYSQEARMYTLLGFFTVVAHLLYLEWNKGATGKMIGYVATSVLGVYTHLFFIFVPVVHLFDAFLRFKPSSSEFLRRGGAIGATYLLYVPWVVVILTNMPEGQGWKGVQHLLGGLPYTFLRFSVGYAELTPFVGWKDQLSGLIMDNWLTLAAIALAFTSLLVTGLKSAYHRGKSGRFVLLAGALPVIGMYALSTVNVVVGVKYLTVVFPVFVILLALGMDNLLLQSRGLSRWIGGGLTVLMLFLTVNALAGHYLDSQSPKADWRDVAELVAKGAALGDRVIFHNSFVSSPFRYYYDRTDGPQLERVTTLEDAVQSSDRFWVIISHASADSRCSQGLRSLNSELNKRVHIPVARNFRNGAGIRVYLLELNNEPETPQAERSRLPTALQDCVS